jgi:signal transduction histidine kinase
VESSGRPRPPLRHRLTDAQWLRIDAAVAVAAFVAGLVRVDLPRAALDRVPLGPAGVALVVIGTLPYAARRRVPLAVLAVSAGSAAVLTGFGRTPTAVDVTAGLSAYTVAIRSGRQAAVAAFTIAEAALCAGAFAAIGRGIAGSYPFLAALVIAAGWFAGNSVRYHRWYLRAVAAEQERRQQEDLDKGRHAVREERIRIARELHDVVAHSLTVMTVQAGVARRVMRDPGQASGVLESIETTGRVAQGELRLILGLLRDDEREDEQEERGLAPAPDLDGLPALAEEVRAAGLPVELRVSGTKPAVSPALELSLYRVIQEALTNAVRHAAGARTTVDLTYGVREIRAEVVNERPAGTAGSAVAPAWGPAGTGLSACASG